VSMREKTGLNVTQSSAYKMSLTLQNLVLGRTWAPYQNTRQFTWQFVLQSGNILNQLSIAH
jgi:hypothetical protein